MRILNCTNHIITEKQKQLGVLEPLNKVVIRENISFDSVEELTDFDKRAKNILDEIHGNQCTTAMIGGAPFFMSYLEQFLLEHGINVAYAFSKRVSVDKVLDDGKVEKVSVFNSDTLIIKSLNNQIQILSN